MRLKTKIYGVILTALCCLLWGYAPARAGAKDSSALYLRHPSLPAFNILLTDSITVFNTGKIPQGKAVLFVMFSPDCDHCEQLIAGILDNIDSFRKVRICLISPMPLYQIRNFSERLQLSSYRQILIGQDMDYFFQHFFNAATVPFVVLYNDSLRIQQVLDHPKNAGSLMEILPR